MISIDRLRLSLPPQFQHRAAWIARSVATMLASMPQTPGQSVSIEKLSLSPLLIDPAHSDQQVAAHIARNISESIQQRVATSANKNRAR